MADVRPMMESIVPQVPKEGFQEGGEGQLGQILLEE